MFVADLFENTQRVVAVYAGRFQPFHKGHKAVYDYLVKKYGRDNVWIATSNKIDGDKSPFSFSDKSQFMALTGVPLDRVVESSQPYRVPELTSQLDAANTAIVFAISQKDMDEDPRFTTGTKKDGSPTYFQRLPNKANDMASLSQHGYLEVVPTVDFTVLGQPMRSATEVRAQYKQADAETRKAIVKDLFGNYSPEVEHIMNAKLGGAVTESIQLENASDLNVGDPVIITGNVQFKGKTGDIVDFGKDNRFVIVNLYNYGKHSFQSSDVSYNDYAESGDEQEYNYNNERDAGLFDDDERYDLEECAGVGVVATNKKMAKDPRYSMSMTQDVKPSTPKKMLKALRLESAESTQSKFERHLAKHGYDVNEKQKYWEKKIKDIDAQIAAWDAEMERRKQGSEMKEDTPGKGPTPQQKKWHQAMKKLQAAKLSRSSFSTRDLERIADLEKKAEDVRKRGVAEAKSLAKRVRVVKTGETGTIRQIKHGAYKGAAKTYYVDLDNGGQADNLPASALRLIKDDVAEGRDNPLQDIDPNRWHLIRGNKPIAINFPNEHKAQSFHSGHWYGRETKVLHGSQVRRNAYLNYNPSVINWPEYSQGVAEGSDPTKKVFLKVNAINTGMPKGWHRVRRIELDPQRNQYYVETKPGYGIYCGVENRQTYSLRNGEGMAITVRQADAILNDQQGVAEGRVDQLPTKGADYSKHDTAQLKTMLRPGVMHRNEAKFKSLIRKELKKREQQGVEEGGEWDEYTGGAPFPDTDDLDTYGGEHDPDDLNESSGTEYRGFDIRASREYGTSSTIYWIYYRGRCTDLGSRTLDGAKKDIDRLITNGFFNDPDEEARKKQRGVAEGKPQAKYTVINHRGGVAVESPTGRLTKGFASTSDAAEWAKKKNAELKNKCVAEGKSTVWEVSFDYGPHMSDSVKVKASSKEEAEAKAERAAKKMGHRYPMINWARPAEQGVAEGGIGKTHISPSGVKTNMPPSDDDYAINYGKNGLVAKDRKARGVDVKTGAKKVSEDAHSQAAKEIHDNLFQGTLNAVDQKNFIRSVLKAHGLTVADAPQVIDLVRKLGYAGNKFKEQGVAEGEYDPSYDPEYRGYSKPERNVDWDIEAKRNAPEEPKSTSTVTVRDNEGNVVLQFPSTGGYYGDVRTAKSKGFDTEGGDYDINWQKNESVTEDAGITADQVAAAIVRRIISQHKDAISAYGPETIMNVARDVGEFYTGAEEFGSSDIGAATRHALRILELKAKGE